MFTSGYKISRSIIDQKLIQDCRLILPSILLDTKYIDTGITFHDLFKKKPDRFPEVEFNQINKNDLFIIPNPCSDYVEFKNLMLCGELWGFAASCFGLSRNDICFSFMNITRKPAKYGPSISWHRDFGNKMTSTTSSRNMLRIIVPLDQSNYNNGATAVIPNSHLIDDSVVLERDVIDINYCNESNESINLMPGDIMGINSKLIHGGGMNKSNQERNNLIFQFVKKGAEHIYEDKEEPFHNLSFNEAVNF
jgi:hypothetical protein